MQVLTLGVYCLSLLVDAQALSLHLQDEQRESRHYQTFLSFLRFLIHKMLDEVLTAFSVLSGMTGKYFTPPLTPLAGRGVWGGVRGSCSKIRTVLEHLSLLQGRSEELEE